MSDRPRVAVVLATFHGERFLPEFLDGLRRQTHRDWTLWARDDGSTDGTTELLRRAAADFRLRLLTDGDHLGSMGSFGRLAGAALHDGADVAFFADQDDVWRPEKIAAMLPMFDTAAPLLAHSDLEVVDAGLKRLHPSFVRSNGLRPTSRNPLRTLLAQNFATGCAMAVNAALLRSALPIPPRAVQHDWWMALVAAATGEIRWTPQRLVRYRQHGGNAVGAKPYWWALLERIRKGGADGFAASIAQVAALRDRLTALGLPVPRPATDYLSVFAAANFRERADRFGRSGVHRQDALRQAVLWGRIVLNRRLPLPSPVVGVE